MCSAEHTHTHKTKRLRRRFDLVKKKNKYLISIIEPRVFDETTRLEEFNVRLVKCTEPILIEDFSVASDNKNQSSSQDDSDYPFKHYDNVFSYIFPPEEWEENGQKWRRVASLKPAFREDVIELDNELQKQLAYWHANDKGLCQIRRELYMQCFDELIRQVSIINVDRGELLIRIRNEFKSTIQVYSQIFKDSLLFSNKKIAITGNKIDKLENEVESLKIKNTSLKKKLADANLNYKNLKENLYEELNALKSANYQEIEFYTGNQEILKEQVNIILAIEK